MECFDNILEKSTVFILIVGFIISINDYFMKYNGDHDDDFIGVIESDVYINGCSDECCDLDDVSAWGQYIIIDKFKNKIEHN